MWIRNRMSKNKPYANYIKPILLLIPVLIFSIIVNINLVQAAETKKPTLSRSNIMQAKVLRQFDGARKSLDEYVGKGKWLIIMVWAYDCSACNKEAHSYEAFHKKHKNKDAVILGITIDGWEKLKESKAFVKRHKITFPNLTVSREFFSLYHLVLTQKELLGTPTFILFSPKGVLKAQQAGSVPVSILEDFISKNN